MSQASLFSPRGEAPLDPATLGALASSAPDLEHVVPFVRPSGKEALSRPSGVAPGGAFSAYAQLLLAGVILAALSRSTAETSYR